MTRFLSRPTEQWFDELHRLFDDVARDRWEGYPPVDIRIAGDEVVLTAEMPGVDKDALLIEVDGSHLTLSGEKPEPPRSEAEVSVHRERSFGKFERTFELGFAVDREAITADYRDGVLTIRLPKAEAARPRRIEVQAS